MLKIPNRYHRIDGWRGFWIPGTAIAGSSDTGSWPDSPCRTDVAKREIARLQRECLRPAGIKSRQRIGVSSNVFCAKRWLCVRADDFSRAKALADAWLAENKHNTQLIHNAE